MLPLFFVYEPGMSELDLRSCLQGQDYSMHIQCSQILILAITFHWYFKLWIRWCYTIDVLTWSKSLLWQSYDKIHHIDIHVLNTYVVYDSRRTSIAYGVIIQCQRSRSNSEFELRIIFILFTPLDLKYWHFTHTLDMWPIGDGGDRDIGRGCQNKLLAVEFYWPPCPIKIVYLMPLCWIRPYPGIYALYRIHLSRDKRP